MSMNRSEREEQSLEHFIEALRQDTDAPAPPLLDADLAAFSRLLVSAERVKSPDFAAQDRVWQKALLEVMPPPPFFLDTVGGRSGTVELSDADDYLPSRRWTGSSMTLAAAVFCVLLFGGIVLYAANRQGDTSSAGAAVTAEVTELRLNSTAIASALPLAVSASQPISAPQVSQPDGYRAVRVEDWGQLTTVGYLMPNEVANLDTVIGIMSSADGGVWALRDAAGQVVLWDRIQALQHGYASVGYTLAGAALSPDGRTTAFGAVDGGLLLVDAASGVQRKLGVAEQRILVAETSDVPYNLVAFSPDGRRVASGSIGAARALYVWDLASGSLVLNMDGFVEDSQTRLRMLTFNNDGRLLAMGSSDGTVQLWDVNVGVLIAALTGHSAEIAGLAFNPDSDLLASAALDNTVRVWSGQNGAALQTLLLPARPSGLSFSPDGAALIVSTVTGDMHFYAVTDGHEMSVIQNAMPISSLAFVQDVSGWMLVLGGGDGTLAIWLVEIF